MIKQLDKEVTEDLCAQQVITSICDCIKELVDNSIDAGSTWIEVQLQQYGKETIRVKDNGSGISSFEFLAQKGSTSKNKGNSEQIRTLGFRGEALHSLAKVSQKMSITSTHQPNQKTIQFDLKKLQVIPIYPPREQHGTTVQIKSLFQYLPVRRYELLNRYKQFLKKTDDIIKQYCLIYSNIKFILKNIKQGKQDIIIETSQGDEKSDQKSRWLGRIRQILGYKISQFLTYMNTQFLQGWILKNIQSGSSKQNAFIRKNIHYLYLNSRPIDPLPKFTSALDQYYKKYNRSTKYVYIINIILPWQTFDVNLTPNKREILIKQALLTKIISSLKQFIEKNIIQNVPVLEGFKQRQQQIKSKLKGLGRIENKKELFPNEVLNENQKHDIYHEKNFINLQQKKTQLIFPNKAQTQKVQKVSTYDEQRKYPNSIKKPNNFQSLNDTTGLSIKISKQQIQQKQPEMNIHTQNKKSIILNKMGGSKIIQSLNQRMCCKKGISNPITHASLGLQSKQNTRQLQPQINYRGINEQITIKAGQPQISKVQNLLQLDQNKNSLSLNLQKVQTKQIKPKPQNQQIIKPPLNPQIEQSQNHNLQKTSFTNFQVIGQFNHGFIVCVYQNKFYLVDQHAASEKYHFQSILNSTKNKAQVYQKVEVNSIQKELIQQNKKNLLENGYQFQIVEGTSSILLTEVPTFLGKNYGKQYFLQLALNNKNLSQISEFYNSAATKACRTAVMVGDVLQPLQMKNIVRELSNLKSPWNCPHGRPTLIYLGLQSQIQNEIKVGSRTYSLL